MTEQLYMNALMTFSIKFLPCYNKPFDESGLAQDHVNNFIIRAARLRHLTCLLCLSGRT